MTLIKCMHDVEISNVRMFTKGKMYISEIFQMFNEVPAFRSINDLGKYHLMGRADDIWFKKNFQIVEDKTIK